MTSGWQTKRIGEVCDVVNGGTPKTGVPDYWDGENLWVTPAEMGNRSNPYIGDTQRQITSLGLRDSSARLLPSKSVILSSRAPIGHLVINLEPMATNQGCKGLVPSGDLHYKFLYYYLTSIRDLLDSLGTGATFRELSGTKLKEVAIPVAPYSEQLRIVRILDDVFDGIAKAKANAQENLSNSRSIFEGVVAQAFTERGEHWLETTLDELSTNLDSKRVPITKSVRSAGLYPYYGASGIVDYVDDYIFEGDTLLISEDGANLVMRSSPIAFSVTGRYWVNNHAHVVKFGEMATQRFVEFYFASIKLDEYITGAAQPKLNQGALNSIPIPIPANVSERAEFVTKLESLQAQTRNLETVYERKLDCLDVLKQSILNQAFTGAL